MSYKNITQLDFTALSVDFLETQDASSRDEFYVTPREMAAEVLKDLKSFLFSKDIAKEERRVQYLALKSEFEVESE